jgi:oligopeptide transport system permease protein
MHIIWQLLRRFFTGVLVLFCVALVTFVLMHQAPGGPFDERKLINHPETLERLNSYYGLDKPLFFNGEAVQEAWEQGERNPLTLGQRVLDSQFFSYIFNAVQGNLGPSYRERGKQVEDILAEYWKYSINLGVLALAFALSLGVPLGIIAALKPNSWLDSAIRFVATLGVSVPVLVTGLLVIFIGTEQGWMKITGKDWDTLTPYIAPALVLGMRTMSVIIRLIRSEILETRRQEYVRTARAKGATEFRVVSHHMTRNVLIPVVTWLGPEVVILITGAVITETMFGVPGIGKFLVESISKRDYSMIMGTTLIYAALIVVATLVVDILTFWLDPRIRRKAA